MTRKKPIYLLAGGQWRRPHAMIPWFTRILAEVGKPAPRVAYLGVANGDDAAFFKFGQTWFKPSGAQVERVILARASADLAKAKSALRRADAIFISGGDVEEGMRWLARHKLTGWLRKLYERGTLFFGLSAGSIMLGTGWVRWADDQDDSTAELFDCLGLAPLLCDTHAEADRWEELLAAVKLLGPGGRGWGIPAGGVIRVAPNGKLAALGKPAVCLENHRGRVRSAAALKVGR